MDDMNATPLNKLPPPIMQSKQGAAPVEAPNYRDLLTEMEASRAPAALVADPYLPAQPVAQQHPPMMQQQPVMMQQPMQMQQQPMQMQQQPAMMMQQQPAMMMQQQPAMMMQQPMPEPGYQYAAPYAEYGDDGDEDAAPPESFVKRCLRANKTTLVVAAVVLLTIMFVLPRLARMPRFATFDGQLNVLGKLAAAAIASGAYRLALLAI